jgi:hypothetical protein
MSAFTGVKVFSASMVGLRAMLDETINQWLAAARRRPSFELVDVVIRQSSDEAFHCISIILFYKEKKR